MKYGIQRLERRVYLEIVPNQTQLCAEFGPKSQNMCAIGQCNLRYIQGWWSKRQRKAWQVSLCCTKAIVFLETCSIYAVEDFIVISFISSIARHQVRGFLKFRESSKMLLTQSMACTPEFSISYEGRIFTPLTENNDVEDNQQETCSQYIQRHG